MYHRIYPLRQRGNAPGFNPQGNRMNRTKKKYSCVSQPVTLRLFYKIRLARTKKSSILQNSRKPAPAHVPIASAALAGMRKEGSLMEANESPVIEAFIQLPGSNPNKYYTMLGYLSSAARMRPAP